MLAMKILSALALVGTLIWFIAQPDYEPAVAIVTSLCALVGTFIAERRAKRKPSQSQTVAAKGIGVQAGGDVNIGNITAGDTKDTNAR